MSFFKTSSIKSSVEVIEECVPNVIIMKEALIKMKLFIQGCSDEIGWLGTAHQEKDNIIIDDVILFDQEVHSTTTEITPEGLSKFGEELLKLPNGVDLWNSIKVWGHSHVNMGTNPSGQDDDQMITFKDCGHDWFIRIIGNKSGDLKLDIYNYKQGITYKNIKWIEGVTKDELEIEEVIKQLQEKLEKFNEDIEDVLKEDIEKDIKSKVRKKTTVITNCNNYYGRSNPWTPKAEKYDKENKENKKDKKNKEVKIKTKEEIHQENIELGMFDKSIMEEVAEASTIYEVMEILDMWGFEGIYTQYTNEEIQKIWNDAYFQAINNYADKYDYYYDIDEGYGDYK